MTNSKQLQETGMIFLQKYDSDGHHYGIRSDYPYNAEELLKKTMEVSEPDTAIILEKESGLDFTERDIFLCVAEHLGYTWKDLYECNITPEDLLRPLKVLEYKRPEIVDKFIDHIIDNQCVYLDEYSKKVSYSVWFDENGVLLGDMDYIVRNEDHNVTHDWCDFDDLDMTAEGLDEVYDCEDPHNCEFMGMIDDMVEEYVRIMQKLD